MLDAGPLGMVTNPRATPTNQEARQWLAALLAGGVRVFIPEIADYEVRRELLRANRAKGVARLNELKAALDYMPLTTATMLLAADFWAQARQQGQPTAVDAALDGDAILAAQAMLIAWQTGETTMIATTNVAHLSRLAPAEHWQRIQPPTP